MFDAKWKTYLPRLAGLMLIALGVVGSIAITRVFANLLVGISAGDAPTYAVVSLAVLLVALTACYIPARFRAARIDPVNALRED